VAASRAGELTSSLDAVRQSWNRFAAHAWAEARSLVRITPIAEPEAMLLAPEQAYFLRENLKLRLLNARLALMSRQHEAARLDLQAAIDLIERHADLKQRRSQLALELLRPVLAQAKPVSWPRPEDSLAALAAAGGVVR
jgi:uroporphyrin-3 C-methyltransferase